MHARSEKDSSLGPVLIIGPYFSWALVTTKLRLPETSFKVSHLVVILARNGPGIFLSGEKKRLYTICGRAMLGDYNQLLDRVKSYFVRNEQ